MNRAIRLGLLAVWMFAAVGAFAQTQEALTNADMVTMTKDGFAPALIVKAIQSSSTNFDVSAQALVELQNAGVDQSVMEAMLTAQANEPSAATEAAHGAMGPADGGAVPSVARRAGRVSVELQRAASG
jgi:hypothetical protein